MPDARHPSATDRVWLSVGLGDRGNGTFGPLGSRVVGKVSFEGAQPLHLRKAWGFNLAPNSGPVVVNGSPASTAVRSGSEWAFAATVKDPSVIREAPSPDAKVVWEGPPGVLLRLGEAVDSYVRVTPPTPDSSAAFVGDARGYPPPPDGGGYAEISDIWVVTPPWHPQALETVVFVPNEKLRLAVTLEGTAETTCQFTLQGGAPPRGAVDAAVAYVLFSRVYQTILHVPAPSADEVQQAPAPEDVAFLVEQARLDIEAELSYLSLLPWPADLEELRDRFGQFGSMCRDASASVLQMLDPAKAPESRATVTPIIEAAGLAAPGPDAQIYEWGETAQSALNRIAESLGADMQELMQPGLTLWEPSILD